MQCQLASHCPGAVWQAEADWPVGWQWVAVQRGSVHLVSSGCTLLYSGTVLYNPYSAVQHAQVMPCTLVLKQNNTADNVMNW